MTESPPDRRIVTPLRRARRWLFFGLVASTTLLGTVMMFDILRAAGVTPLELLILGLFAPTFAWISLSFWNASIGFVLLMTRRDPLSLKKLGRGKRVEVHGSSRNGSRGGAGFGEAPLRTRTALVMPVRNEDTDAVTRRLEAMLRSLSETGHADAFGVHLLSDTTDAELARREEEAWSRLIERAPHPERLAYRRRSDNVGRKAGNVADFCRTHGDEYDFMVVLDADSVMSGPTLVELARTMEANPSAGLIQTVPIPSGQETLFGRFVQFAGALYSPLLATGQSFWQMDTANYWGHNAILRVDPFREHCRLPVLPGRPPLGGEILSHDFVEAALLRRAGWTCWLLPLLGGSYEEVPANVFDYMRRDRRWAQGSLQHLRLLREPGLKALSRLHFVLGAMGYLSSVLWLLILLASTAYVLAPALSANPIGGSEIEWLPWAPGGTSSFLPLLALTALILFLPKGIGVLVALVRERRAFGGSGRLLVSGGLEAVFAVVVAPLTMFDHVRSVSQILTGQNVPWGAQPRRARTIAWRDALRGTSTATLLGAAWAGVTIVASPLFFLWLTPVFAGILLSGPLVRLTSQSSLGRGMRGAGLLLVPSETSTPPELRQGPEEVLRDRRRFNKKREVVRSMYDAERGLFDIRRGRLLCLTDTAGQVQERSTLMAAVESVDEPTLAQVRRLGTDDLRLVVTRERAQAMRLSLDGVSEQGVADAVSISIDVETTEQLFRMASSRGPVAVPPDGVRPASNVEAAGLGLTRLGRMLPAVVCVQVDASAKAELDADLESGAILRVDTAQILDMLGATDRPGGVRLVSSAPVPLGQDENARFLLFREANGLLEHVAILIGDREHWPDPVPARLHSACLTGDLFGSLRCDCGEQLRGSLDVFEASGGGVLLYLAQEGRGIGLGNKLRAYALQGEGLDTVDADSVLGFGADERRYAVAVGMLRQLGIERVRLLTNNPDKVKALENGGIRVVVRQPLHGTLNRHNLPYVTAKVQRAGHWLGDMLHGTSRGT